MFHAALCSSFTDIDYVESYNCTEYSFVRRYDGSDLTKKDIQASNDTLDKLDVSIKDDMIRNWIESTSIYHMNK